MNWLIGAALVALVLAVWRVGSIVRAGLNPDLPEPVREDPPEDVPEWIAVRRAKGWDI